MDSKLFHSPIIKGIRNIAMLYRIIITSVLIVGFVLLVSCASKIPSVATLAKQPDTEQADPTSIDSYTIGPGDVLSVDVWKEPDLSKQVVVRLDGSISLPLVNDVKVADHTVPEVQKQLIEKYQDYLTAPEVSVTLLASHSKKVYVLGKINSPGEYPLQKNMTIVQAISLAGGLGPWADTSDIRLIRKIKGVEKTYRVDYDAIVSGEDLSQNVLLKPDDTIFVP